MKLNELIPCDPKCNRNYYRHGLTICFGDLSEEAKNKYCLFFGADFDDETPIAGDLASFIDEGCIERK